MHLDWFWLEMMLTCFGFSSCCIFQFIRPISLFFYLQLVSGFSSIQQLNPVCITLLIYYNILLTGLIFDRAGLHFVEERVGKGCLKHVCFNERFGSSFPRSWTKSVSFILESLILMSSLGSFNFSIFCYWSLHDVLLNGNFSGIEVWRIENFSPAPIPKSSIGKFFTGDSYIVLKVNY